MFQRYMRRGSGSTSPTEQQCRRFSLAEIKSATQDFKEGLVVGRGGFGKVYKGFIKNREEVVAVKRLSSVSNQGENEFRMEIETLSRLRHLHLVSLIGYCNEGTERILVYEYMPGGTLVDHLYKTKGVDHPPLSWKKRLQICIGAARGLDYLHTGTEPGVIHRDVKDSNILLNEKLVAKIADFGLAKLEHIDPLQSHVSTNVKGSFGYMDPEYVLTRRISKKSDVYAFGVVLLVVLSGRPAVDMRVEEDQQSLVLYAKKCMEEGRLDQIIDPYLKLEIQSNSLEEFIKVVEKCLLKQPKERPSMTQVVANLELAMENQHGALSSTSQEVDGNWTAQFDPTSDERFNNNYVSGDGEDPNFEPRRNDCGTPQRYEDILAETSESVPFEDSIRIFALSELKVATKDFRYALSLGEGSSGVCYKGWLVEPIGSRSLVCVKQWRRESYPFREDFQNGMTTMKALSHPNVLNLLGYCCENDMFLSVHKFMNNGSLDNHLFLPRDSLVQPLSWGLRLKICSDVAQGLAIMHSLETPIIHGDIKPSKILLDESFDAKLCGFSLARFGPTGIETTHVSTTVMGTIGYAAPEYLATGHLRVKSDVYAFGVILVEMLTGLRSFDPQRPSEQRSLIDWKQASLSSKRKLRHIMDPRLEGQYSMRVALQVAELALKCHSALPRTRPSMREVLQTLEHIQSTN